MGIADGLMNQTIDKISTVVIDGYGNKTLTTIYENVKCRWSPTIVRITDSVGDIKEVRIEVWIPPMYTILSSYIVTKDEEKYSVIQTYEAINLTGEVDHIKVFLA